jgi:hypothetical protein
MDPGFDDDYNLKKYNRIFFSLLIKNCKKASIKDVQATGEAFSPQKIRIRIHNSALMLLNMTPPGFTLIYSLYSVFSD